jgi:hypothetical protein
MKSALKEELEMKRRLVKENLQANLEVEKEQYLGTKQGQDKAEKKKAKQEKKNKKLKYQL